MSAPIKIPQSLQELLPKWAHFCLYTERFITRDLGISLSGAHVVVGVSGGVDSTALLLVLKYLSARNDCRVTAAHLNHKLRSEADADAQWVKALCSAVDVRCECKEIDIKAQADAEGVGLEEAGRNARYAFFKDVREAVSGDYVAVGHHLGDLSEDILMRFIRGTGWPGLSGMSGYSPERLLIRPFLMLPKSTLIAFVEHLGIEWREDETNAQDDATRNRIRNELLPLIMRENPSFPDAMGRLWKIGRLESDYWAEITADNADHISNALLDGSHKAVRLRLYKSKLDMLGPGQVLAHTLFKLDDAWEENRYGATLQFPGDKTATITSEGVVFSVNH